MESLLGLGQKSPRLLCWCEEGRINAARALFTRSPSTPRILTSEFVIADLRALRRFGEYGAAATVAWLFLWRLQRKEPGCVVGEHMHVRFCWRGLLCRGATAMERFGDTERSRENRTEEEPERLTRVGEEGRLKKVVEREEKLEVEDAKAEEEEDGECEWKPCSALWFGKPSFTRDYFLKKG
ncbi:hypothetical protein CR513_61814, partial [Mucuna pruriens]